MRYQIAEVPNILGKFNTGDTVTITLYDLSDESSETLTSNACSELGSTGVFYWSTSNITTQPTTFTEYAWVMTNSTTSQYGKIVLGGYPENCDSKISAITVDNSAIADAVWDEANRSHESVDTFGGLMMLLFRHIGFDYKWLKDELKKLKVKPVDEEKILAKFDEIKPTDLTEVNNGINNLMESIKNIPEYKETDLTETHKFITDVKKQVENIKIPEYKELNFSEVLQAIQEAKPDLSEFKEIKEILNNSSKEYKQNIQNILDKLDSRIENIKKDIVTIEKTLLFSSEKTVAENSQNHEKLLSNLREVVFAINKLNTMSKEEASRIKKITNFTGLENTLKKINY